MNFFETVILSIIEGITEFLPISSTGHMILAADILNIEQTPFVKSFEIIVQLGAILGIVFLYAKTLMRNREVWKRVMLAFIPTVIIGLSLYKVFKHFLLGNTVLTLGALFFGGIILIIIEYVYREKEHSSKAIESMKLKTAFSIGLIQTISMIPGVSRAAATIVGGMCLGLDRKTAAEFSFLLAVPTMLAASGLDILKSDFTFTFTEYSIIGMGFIISFFVAIITVKFFIRYIQTHNFIVFGIYRIVLAVLFWGMIVRG